MQFKLAETADIDSVFLLYYKYQIDFISEKDKQEGSIKTPFTREDLISLIQDVIQEVECTNNHSVP